MTPGVWVVLDPNGYVVADYYSRPAAEDDLDTRTPGHALDWRADT